jgi:hypothetical protein
MTHDGTLRFPPPLVVESNLLLLLCLTRLATAVPEVTMRAAGRRWARAYPTQ